MELAVSENKTLPVQANGTVLFPSPFIFRPVLFAGTRNAHYQTTVCVARSCRPCRAGWFAEVFRFLKQRKHYNPKEVAHYAPK